MLAHHTDTGEGHFTWVCLGPMLLPSGPPLFGVPT